MSTDLQFKQVVFHALKRGYNLRDFANEFKVAPVVVQKWANGEVIPDENTQKRVIASLQTRFKS
jgi:hypothetical protein